MNKKLLFVSIIAIVTAFAAAAVASGLGTQTVLAVNCKGYQDLVNAQVCGTQVCANAQAITSLSQANCKNGQQ